MAVAERRILPLSEQLLLPPRGEISAMGGSMGHELSLDNLPRGTAVGILPFASADPGDSTRYYSELYYKYNLHPRVPQDHADLTSLPYIFLTGGHQLRFFHEMRNTQLHPGFIESYKQGARIVTTSAGSAELGSTTIVGINPHNTTYGVEIDEQLESNALAKGKILDSSTDHEVHVLVPGLGLLPDTTVDSHFSQRGRLQRLKSAILLQQPGHLGLGIDEKTILNIKQGETCIVNGYGSVYVVFQGPTGIEVQSFSDGEKFSLSQFRTGNNIKMM